MKTADIIRRSGRSLQHAKGRTILTSLAIAVGAFTLTLSLAAGEGARQYADKLISSNIDQQSVFIAKDASLFGEGGTMGARGLKEYSTDTTQYGGTTFKSLNQKDIENIRANPGVASVFPTYNVSAQYVTFDSSATKYVVDVTAYDSRVRSDVAAGELPELGKQIADNGIIVPESYLVKLGDRSPESMIGKKVTLHLVKAANQPSEEEVRQILAAEGGAGVLQKRLTPETKDIIVEIVAISAKSSTALTAGSGLFISENKARELSEYLTQGTSQYKKYITATARVKNGVDPAKVRAELEKNGVSVRTAQDLQSLLFTIVNILQGIVIGFGVIALIASIFGIINTQYISVLERTREIGLMKALGMRGRHVLRLFQFEAAWIGLFGGLMGAGSAWAIGIAINPWITEQLNLGRGSSLLIFQIIPTVLLVLGLMLIAMIAGWFPARKAARLDPIEALRTE